MTEAFRVTLNSNFKDFQTKEEAIEFLFKHNFAYASVRKITYSGVEPTKEAVEDVKE